MKATPSIVPVGDSAVSIPMGDEIDISINRHVHALASLVEASSLAGIVESVPAYGTLLIHYDPLVLTYAEIREWLSLKLDQLSETVSRKSRPIEVPVHYGGQLGMDLEWVASYHQLTVEEVIRIHTERTYIIYMMGFTPGFPYMGKLDDRIVTPRLGTPRTKVAAGTVAIAGSQTGIYPIESPGGWRLIGYTALKLFDPYSDAPFLLAPGDEVRFVAES